jgi:hypothetical protein
LKEVLKYSSNFGLLYRTLVTEISPCRLEQRKTALIVRDLTIAMDVSRRRDGQKESGERRSKERRRGEKNSWKEQGKEQLEGARKRMAWYSKVVHGK